MRRVLVFCIGVLASAPWPRLARAEEPAGAQSSKFGQLALGVDESTVVYDNRDHAVGLGFDTRLGIRFGLPRRAFLDRTFIGQLIFQIEAIGGIRAVPAFRSVDYATQAGRAGGGLRVGRVYERFEIFVMSHAGIAFAKTQDAFQWDLGAAFDWRFSNSSLGLHAAYFYLSSGERWLELGPHYEMHWLP